MFLIKRPGWEFKRINGCASLLHWVYVLERVRIGASLWDYILVYFGWEYELPIHFCERGERPFFSISGSLLYPSFHLFRMWLLSMLWCKLTITHFSISLLSSIFILFLNSTLPHLISLFSHPAWYSTWVQHPHFNLAYSMCPFLYHHFSCRNILVWDSWCFLHIASHAWGDYYHWDLWA